MARIIASTGVTKDLRQPQLKVLNETEAEWRTYFAENKTPPRFSDINILLTDHIKTHDTAVTGLDYYFTRMIDFTIWQIIRASVFMFIANS